MNQFYSQQNYSPQMQQCYSGVMTGMDPVYLEYCKELLRHERFMMKEARRDRDEELRSKAFSSIIANSGQMLVQDKRGHYQLLMDEQITEVYHLIPDELFRDLDLYFVFFAGKDSPMIINDKILMSSPRLVGAIQENTNKTVNLLPTEKRSADLLRQRTVEDTTAHDDALREKEEQMGSLRREIDGVEQNIRDAAPPEESSDELELKYSHLQEQLTQSREELSKLLVEGQAEIKRKSDKAMQRHKDEIMSALSDVLSAFVEKAEKYLNDQRRTYCRVVQEVISSTYSHALQTLKEQYSNVVRDMQLEDNERRSRICEAEESLNCAAQLIEIGSDLIVTLGMEMSDQIEKEVFADVRQQEDALV